MERQNRDEELRLEKLILERDAASLELVKEEQRKLKKINEKHAKELKKALEYRELQRFVEAQRIEDEARALEKAKIALERDRLAKENEKRERIAKSRKDFEETSKVADYFRNLAFEEKRAAEMKAQEYMRLKAEREKELEKEKQLLREQKQREDDRLHRLQIQMQSSKSHLERMHMRRIQEQNEREYRRREMEAALKRKEFQTQVIETRTKQIEEMKKARAAEEEEMRIEHEQTMKKLKEAEEREKRKMEKLHDLKNKYRQGNLTKLIDFYNFLIIFKTIHRNSHSNRAKGTG